MSLPGEMGSGGILENALPSVTPRNPREATIQRLTKVGEGKEVERERGRVEVSATNRLGYPSLTSVYGAWRN